MENETFEDWFANVFVSETRHLNGPTILVLDGHKSHLTMRVVQKAITHNISIVCLPAHSTHLLQPLDVAVFSPVKTAWRKIVSRENKENSFQNIDKSTFTNYFSQLIAGREAFKQAHVVSGFDTTGIFPLDRTRIPEEKLTINKTFQHVVSARSYGNEDGGEHDSDESDDGNDGNDNDDGNDDHNDDDSIDDSDDGRGGKHVMHLRGRSDDEENDVVSQVVLSLPMQRTFLEARTSRSVDVDDAPVTQVITHLI